MKIIILFAILAGIASCKPVEEIDFWNITYTAEEILRGSGYGLLKGMGLNKSSECFANMSRLFDFIKDITEMIKKKNYDFKMFAKLLNDIAQWFAGEWYSCGDLINFGPEFARYWERIVADIPGYLGKFFLGILKDFFKILNETYWFIYHQAREEYFDAGSVLGDFVYRRFLLIVKYWL